MMRMIALLCGILALTAGCSTARPVADNDALAKAQARVAAERAKNARAPGEVAPGFEIKLSNSEDESLNGKFRIEFEGRLKLPYDVTVDTNGLTREQLRARINEAYTKFFKNAPNIAVSVAEERYWVAVRGLVEKPGRYLVKASTSLDEVLAMAGGLQKTSPARYVKIQQGKVSTTIKLSEYYADPTHENVPAWQGGDNLFFESERGEATGSPSEVEGAYVQLFGEVHNPGEYRYVPGADVYYFLAKAGGPTALADLRGGVQLIRNTPDGKTLTQFGLSVPKDVPPVQPGDQLLLLSDKPTPFERTVPLVGSVIGILNTILLMVLVF